MKIRAARKWKPGARLADVVGSAGYKGRRKTLKEMGAAILREARKRR
jgi:hypothetical protein